MAEQLKAPFPWFGGKSKVSQLVWSRLGDVNNYIEPFAGSLSVLLRRPTPPRVETVNDLDCYLANFWRATAHDPEGVAEHADGPVNEADLHARHRWLVLSGPGAEFRARMRQDPEFYDTRIAGWWCWGLCCWIGGGWCAVPGETEGEVGCEQGRRPSIAMPGSQAGQGVHGLPEKLPKLSGDSTHSAGACGLGVHANGPLTADGDLIQRRPILGGDNPGGGHGKGVHAKGDTEPQLRQKMPTMEQCRTAGKGVHGIGEGHRPQLADAYSRGRGVHGEDAAETCAQRRAWLLAWFRRLRDRLRCVRVCCGDWARVCSSESVTVRLGSTGVFLDPPYGGMARRTACLYATDSLTVAEEVRAWSLEWGVHPSMRIALCGYAGEGHEALEKQGWDCVPWKAHGGYGNRTARGKANAARERIWFSPHCNHQRGLFD